MVMEQISAIGAAILEFLAPITPYVGFIITTIIPIYIAIGGVLVKIGELLLSVLPEGTSIVSYILLGIFVILGVIGGILGKTKEEKEKKATDEAINKSNPKEPENNYDF